MTGPRQVEAILPSPPPHWVGDGFPVRSVFSPQSVRTRLSPFILFDFAGPAAFPPSDRPRGVDSHPHRGFETVTVVYQGEIEHRDSAGNSGRIGPGDVQWMTAASGVLHEEKHSSEFTRRGGVLEMAQLWVNLPAQKKMTQPRYQELPSASIPVFELPGRAGLVRVIAGKLFETPGASRTMTPVILWDATLQGGANAAFPVVEGFNIAVFVRKGALRVGDGPAVVAGQLAILLQSGDSISLRAEEACECLVIGGEPIDEPMVASGPFVMNSPEEIRQAIQDTRAGRLGRRD